MTLFLAPLRRSLAGLARILQAIVLAGACLAPSGPAAADPLDGAVAQGLGIAAHWPNAADLDQIAELGIGIVRTDLSWARTEQAPGVYDFGVYLEMAAAMRARGLRPMFILDYGNPLHSPMVALTHRGVAQQRAAAPAAPEAVAAYAAWAAAAVAAFAEFDPVWEIWNEPDHARFWPPAPDPAAYARLADSACRAMRAASPSRLTILGPAVADWIDSAYLGDVLRSEAVACFDAISVHPYQVRAVGDEDAAVWGGLRRQIDAAQPGRALPIANSEWGRSQIGGVTEAQQAAYLVRSLAVNQAAGVRLNVWYVWKDPGDAPGNDQHHFGIKRYDGTFRLAHDAIRTLTTQIGAARFRCISHDGGLTQALFAEPGEGGAATLVMWSQGRSRDWTPPAGLIVRSAVAMTGKALDPERLALAIRVPVYLKVDPASSSLPCAA